MAPVGFEDKVAFVWKVADTLRGTFKQHEYGSVMLPLLVLRRMDAVLAPTREQVREIAAKHPKINEGTDALLKRASGHIFYNTSRHTFSSMLSDDKNVAANLRDYIYRLSPTARTIIEAYEFENRLERMDRAGILYAVLANFADLDLRPSVVSNEAMGYVFEELLRKFSEMSNETAGEHYTPREVIQLIVDLLVAGRAARELTENPAPVRTVYDPAAAAGANEEASARLAEADLAAAALSETDVAVVAELVRATAEHALPGPSGAHAVLHDADLWILSAPPTRYADYTAQVRREYAAVPDPDFARGRAAILAPFLDRDRLYATQQAHREWTARARDNLADELARLTR